MIYLRFSVRFLLRNSSFRTLFGDYNVMGCDGTQWIWIMQKGWVIILEFNATTAIISTWRNWKYKFV